MATEVVPEVWKYHEMVWEQVLPVPWRSLDCVYRSSAYRACIDASDWNTKTWTWDPCGLRILRYRRLRLYSYTWNVHFQTVLSHSLYVEQGLSKHPVAYEKAEERINTRTHVHSSPKRFPVDDFSDKPDDTEASPFHGEMKEEAVDEENNESISGVSDFLLNETSPCWRNGSKMSWQNNFPCKVITFAEEKLHSNFMSWSSRYFPRKDIVILKVLL